MIITRVDPNLQAKLIVALEKNTRSFARRGVSISCQAQSDVVGSVTIRVSGRKGIAEKIITVVYDRKDGTWNCYCQGYQYNILTLGEISTIVKSQIQRVYTIVSKF